MGNGQMARTKIIHKSALCLDKSETITPLHWLNNQGKRARSYLDPPPHPPTQGLREGGRDQNLKVVGLEPKRH